VSQDGSAIDPHTFTASAYREFCSDRPRSRPSLHHRSLRHPHQAASAHHGHRRCIRCHRRFLRRCLAV
jgi:hypothetical protein